MRFRALGLFALSLAAGAAVWRVKASSADSYSKGHLIWPLAALCVVAAAAAIYLVVSDAQKRQ